MALQSFPPALQELIEEFGRLPGIGRKTATRLALHILNSPKTEAKVLSNAILNVKEKIQLCSICFNITEQDICEICRDKNRNQKQICVVEDPVSIMLIDRTNEYNGLFHVLGGVISPLDGIGPEQLHIKELLQRLEKDEELIFALNPSTEGEATTIYLSKLIKPMGVQITRLASGIPMGSTLEFVDELTLSKALKTRSEV